MARAVILLAAISLDGYLARPNGSLDYLVMTKEASARMESLFATIDTILMGRKTLDAAIAMSGGSYKSPVDVPTYVFSRTRPGGVRGGVIFTHQSPVAWLKKIRERPGKNILHMGGGELAREFLQADLIDELYTLVENNTYSKSQISLTYRRVRAKTKSKGRPS